MLTACAQVLVTDATVASIAAAKAAGNSPAPGMTNVLVAHRMA
jgi:hypothetical protein